MTGIALLRAYIREAYAMKGATTNVTRDSTLYDMHPVLHLGGWLCGDQDDDEAEFDDDLGEPFKRV